MLLIWVQQIPVKLGSEICRAAYRHQECLYIEKLTDDSRRANRVTQRLGSLLGAFDFLATLERSLALPLFALLHARAVARRIAFHNLL